jgi:hypothetical protein
MKSLVLTITLTILFAISTNGKVWRVDMNTANNPDFTDLQTAVNDAKVVAGDTIILAGHPMSYGSLTLEKRITLIGTGYFIKENNFKYENIFPARIENLTINAGAANSVVISIEFTNNVGIYVDGIIFDRNYVHNGITIQGCKNCIIKRNDVGGQVQIYSSSQYIIVKNNIVASFYSYPGSTFTFINNTSAGSATLQGGGMYFNNISSNFNNLANADVRGNICSDGSLASYPGNLSNVDFASLFITSDSPDGKWQLKDGSVAKGYGVNGVDCGMYGGDEPYILSGIPPIPTIYEAIVPSTVTAKDGLPVKIKAKANN